MKFSILFALLVAGCQVLTDGALPSIAQALTPLTLAETKLGESRNQCSPTATSAFANNDRVLVETKTVTVTRGKKGEAYPNYKEAIVKYPQVTGLSDQAVLRHVQAATSLKSVFGQSLAELRAEFQKSWWLSEIDYTVHYNQRALLDLTFTISGVGAYPSTYDKHRLVNLKTGKIVNAADVFKRESVGTIAVMVNKVMQAEMKQAIANGDKEGADLREQLSRQRFQIKHLNSFTVSDKGITFLYDFGFPHVMLALEPSGRYFFSYDQLRAYIKLDGALNLALTDASNCSEN
ncbi:MAG: DUF4163 domain-containing protein [Tildeniella nuda ZEHNDER 1965/U140]|jgi:hypothetical protein|nr:DUF4163 domain-containing protein [Tildeniella nuda ZEHNDER 1965/U140]